MSEEREEKSGLRKPFSRRIFMKGFGSSVVTVSTLTTATTPLLEQEGTAAESATLLGPGTVPITLMVNGATYKTQAEPRETLLEVLRNRLDITGPKLICDMGTCGGCTVYLDGKTVYSCMTLAIEAQGKEITTVEGLSQGDRLHSVQEALVEADGIQCGFCTPGIAMSMASVFNENPSASLDEVKAGISGHICRCGTYAQIFKAAELARTKVGG